MGDEFCGGPSASRQQKRRKVSFPPVISFQESDACRNLDGDPATVPTIPLTSLGKKCQEMRDRDTQTLNLLDNCGDLSVDLDALEHSDDQMSAHSSTSGVSSLLPRKCKPRGHSPNAYPALRMDCVNDTYSRTSATCSDAADSINSASTLHPVTPWIMSLKDNSLERLGSERSSKRQRLSSVQSNYSSNSDGFQNSLFYHSKTTYGGAASCGLPLRRHDLFKTTVPLRFELESQATGSGSTALCVNGPNLSSTARRILESLERFTTPLATADRIPTPLHSQSSTPILQKKSFRTHRFPPYIQAYNHLKTVQRQKLDASGCLPLPEIPVSVGPAVNHFRSVADRTDSTPTAPVTVSFGVKLPESARTELGFQHLPLLTTHVQTTSVPSVTAPVPLLSPSASSTSPETSRTFTFAPPLKRPPSIACRLAALPSSQLPSKYEFCAPKRLGRSSSSILRSNSTSVEPTNIPACSQLSKSLSSPIFEMIMSSSATQLPSVTISQGKNIPFPLGSMWRCETCLLENAESRDTCVACSVPRLKKVLHVDRPVTSMSSSLPTASSKWECPVCMVFNEQEVPECIACKAKRPHSTYTSSMNSPVLLPSSTCVGNKWECPTCMVFNESLQTSCVCCQTGKPGNKVGDLTSQAPSADWECPTCMVRNSTTKQSCPCCSTPKPNTLRSSSASLFGVPTPVASFPIKFGLFGSSSQTSSTSTASVGVTLNSGLNSVVTTPHSDVSNSGKVTEPPKSSVPILTFGVPTPCVSTQATSTSTVSVTVGTTVSDSSSSSFIFTPFTSATGVSVASSVSLVAPVLNFGSLGKRSLPGAMPHATSDFQFGLPNAPKSQMPAPNGLVNGGTVELFTSKSVPSFNYFAAQSESSKNQTIPLNITTPSQPAAPFPFVSTTSVPENVTPSDGFAVSSSVFPKFGAVDGLSTPAFTSTGSGLFCFGAAGKSSEQSLNSNSQPFVFGQGGSQPTSNVFSVNSTAPRKKAHAVRRFQR
ncbi:nuclear pore complex protein Nup153 [Clonorchis sinensis]|uniref:Nuclear pore complex protein Nup153 n=1 Tax=Clonorchis sinensis TaxID=79923 RepID=G7Y9J0_CLOSI|nr:nuclear pore complex protein Nup153 [Clonorchis sinensis]